METRRTILLGDDGRRPSYGWAFSASTWIHLLALVLVAWLPLSRPRHDEERSVVEFDVKKDVVAQPMPRSRRQERQSVRPIPSPPRSPAAIRRRDDVLPLVARRTPPKEAGTSSPVPTPPAASASVEREAKLAGGLSGGAGSPAAGPGRGAGAPGTSELSRALAEFRRSLLASQGDGGGGTGAGGDGTGGTGIGLGPPGAGGFGFGDLFFEGADYDFAKSGYGWQVHYAIQRAWYRRLYAMSELFERWAASRGDWRLDHRNRIRFVVGRSGQIVRAEMIDESGCRPLDTSATDALREVVLPPLPADFPRTEEGVVVTFLATGDIHLMRTDPELRAAYYGGASPSM